MLDSSKLQSPLPREALIAYEGGNEAQRLTSGVGQLEWVRIQELVQCYLRLPPAVIFDVDGEPGGYSVVIGDARQLDRPGASVDAVLLFGPRYHLTDRHDRVTALCEARRILRDSGLALGVGISRFASPLDGLIRRYLDDPEFGRIVQGVLTDGQHRNPTNHPGYFSTAFFHYPDELKAEIEEPGLHHECTMAIEGPGWLLQNFEEHWRDQARLERLLSALPWLEDEPSLLGMSAHMMAIARKDL
jgi:hypothetical protein